jgi:hypothetical protein
VRMVVVTKDETMIAAAALSPYCLFMPPEWTYSSAADRSSVAPAFLAG